MNSIITLQDYGNEVRGCPTREHIDMDETIISIPLKCLITVEMGKDTDVSRLHFYIMKILKVNLFVLIL